MSLPAPAIGQVAPQTPVHVTINGVFFLCPTLVRTQGVLSQADLSKLGFDAMGDNGPGVKQFKGVGDKGLLTVEYEIEAKTCVLNYGGGGYEAIAGVVKDTVTGNGFTRVTGGDRDGAKADVFDGKSPEGDKAVRVTVIQNDSQRTSSISYAEK